MKKLVLATLIGAGLAVSQVAAAADGTITFNGKLVDTTCTISTGTKNQTVTLPTLPTTSLTAGGETGGYTPFVITLENCSAATTKARVYFEPRGAQVNLNTGRLINKATGQSVAQNVEIQLLDASNNDTVIDASKAISGQNTQLQTITGTTGDLRYAAQYYATAQTTAGDVTASVQYSVAYE